MSFAFVPRKVAKTSKDHASPTIRIPENAPRPSLPPPAPVLQITRPVGLPSDEEICTLLGLALSDYAIWSDSKLLRILVSEREGKNEGYISLLDLLRDSLLLTGMNLEKHENLVAKALRAHAQDTIEVRMTMSPSPLVGWSTNSTHASSAEPGSYQVRRVKINQEITSYTREDWEARTLYMENIPPAVRSIAQLVSFTSLLLPEAKHSDVVQHIDLPKHHTEKKLSRSQLKGFALVTFTNVTLKQQLHDQWPWGASSNAYGASEEVLNAQHAGFRTLPKKRWEQLNEEYLAYLQNLAEEATAHQPPELISLRVLSGQEPASFSGLNPLPDKTRQPIPQDTVSPDAPFPPGCLVFVKRLHPDTNKTTLRSLFGLAGNGISIDYVDFKKGTDTCYLRLCNPKQARVLVDYFTERQLAQTDGLDAKGKPVSDAAESGPINLEVVQGRAEQVYWERVPEKIRRDAVKKALSYAD